MKKIFILLAICLVGCSHPDVKPNYIPIPAKPISVNIPKEPDFPINKLNSKSRNSEVIKAYVATVFEQQQYINALLHILRSY